MAVHTPIVHQSEASECGLACLAMVYGHHESAIDLRTMRSDFLAKDLVGGHGVTMNSLTSCATILGFVHRALKVELQRIGDVRLPAILHWDMNHFVVLVKTRSRGCVVHDPAIGRVELSWTEFGKHFTGVVLELWPGKELRKYSGRIAKLDLREVWQLASGTRATIVWVVVLSVLLQLFLLAGPWQVQWSLDKALLTGDVSLLFVLALGFGFLLVLRTLTHWLRGSLVVHVGHAMAFGLSSRLLRHLLALPASWFAKRHSGDVLSRFSSLAPVRDLFTQGAATLLVDCLMVVLSLTAMLIYSWGLTLIVLLCNGVYCLVYLAVVGRVKRLSMSAVVAEAAEQAHLLESAQSIQSVKVYAQEVRRLTDWQNLHAKTLSHSMDLQRTELDVSSVGMLGAGLELTLVVYWGAHSVLDQSFTIGMLFAFLSYRGHFSERLQSAVGQLVNVRTLRVHLQRLADIWCEDAERGPSDNSIAPNAGSAKKIYVARLSFRYSEAATWLLEDANLTVAPGEFVAVVGDSGTGKTTLLKLMMGLLTATHGEVRIGDQVFATATAVALRRRMSCVFAEESGLFAASVADNITLFETRDEQRLDSVLMKVGMADTIKGLPMGLATHVGDMASGLSAGQLQRLMVARAIYRQPNYLFLDEPTANLDVTNARAITSLVAGMGCTRIAVTHDLEFARAADRVYELRDARLIDCDLG